MGLAHRRRSTVVPSARRYQTIADDAGPAVIVFNGEIYNFAELRQELQARGWRFNSTSDTEVLLKRYHEFGMSRRARADR